MRRGKWWLSEMNYLPIVRRNKVETKSVIDKIWLIFTRDGGIILVGKLEFLTRGKGIFIMLAELRQKSQITIPKDIVTKLGLSEGDKLEVSEKDGMICVTPVAVYPKNYLRALRDEIGKTKTKITEGKQPSFDSVDALFAKLEEN
jgi:AbrB family looped-hinge helix DNA binding protein